MKKKMPRKLSLVKFDFDSLDVKFHSQYPFSRHEHCIFLGEIPNMDGHCVIGTKSGNITFGWHTDNFVEVTEDEA